MTTHKRENKNAYKATRWVGVLRTCGGLALHKRKRPSTSVSHRTRHTQTTYPQKLFGADKRKMGQSKRSACKNANKEKAQKLTAVD